MVIPVFRTTLGLLAVLFASAPFLTTLADAGVSAGQQGSMVGCAVALAAVAVLVRTSDESTPASPVPVVDPLPWVDPPLDHAAAPGVGTPGQVPVGRTGDGRPVTLDATAGIVVIGHGALAVAVFAAMVVALGRCASEHDETRTAFSDDVPFHDDDRPLPGSVRRAGSGLGPGTAVAVLLDARGERIASAVLIPDLGSVPRRAGPTVAVTRYGCTVRTRSGETTGERVTPVLPELDHPEAL